MTCPMCKRRTELYARKRDFDEEVEEKVRQEERRENLLRDGSRRPSRDQACCRSEVSPEEISEEEAQKDEKEVV